MAIALDTSAGSSQIGGNSISYSHTVTGTSPILVIIVRTQNAATGVSTITYNGSSTGITQVDNQTAVGYNLTTYYLINPPTGAHTLAVTLTGNTNWTLCSASYTGCNQLTQGDIHAKAAASSVAMSITNPNCWIVGGAGGTSLTAGTGYTQRQDQSAGGNEGSLIDSNGIVSTGSNTISSGGTVGVIAGFVINPIASTLYWVGGTGNWDTSTATHWASSSGGTGGFGIPDSTVAVIFDANSGGGTVTVSANTACSSLVTTGYTGTITQSSTLAVGGVITLGSHTYTVSAALSTTSNLTMGTTTIFAGSSATSIGGNLTLTSGMTLSYTGPITFDSTASGKTITTAGKTVGSTLTFNGVGGGWTLQDALTSSTSITVTNGTLNFGGFAVTATTISNAGTLITGNGNMSFTTFTNTGTLTLGSGTVTLTGTGTVWSGAGTITPSTSTINLTNSSSSSKTFAGGGLTYYDLKITSASTGTYTISGDNTFHNFYLTGSGTGTLTISGNNTYTDFKADTPPHTILFGALKRQSVQTWTVSGTAGNLMTLHSTVSGTQWILYKSIAGNVVSDYLSLKDSFAESVGT